MEGTKPQALQRLKIVECAQFVAAPLIGRMMADFGAEVIHVEHPIHSDQIRRFGFTKDGINPWWKYYSRNKKYITLDISKDKGRALLLQLLKDADVFVENFRPGRLEEWNIHYDDLAKMNPRLIMVRVTGFGQNGPYSSQPGFGTLLEAMSGFAAMVGEAVASVLAQTYRPLELIVVDDGSTDDTADRLAAYGEQVRLLRTEHRGPAAARNAGILASKGEYVAFLDSDDLWLPEKVAHSLAPLLVARPAGAGRCSSRRRAGVGRLRRRAGCAAGRANGNSRRAA